MARIRSPVFLDPLYPEWEAVCVSGIKLWFLVFPVHTQIFTQKQYHLPNIMTPVCRLNMNLNKVVHLWKTGKKNEIKYARSAFKNRVLKKNDRSEWTQSSHIFKYRLQTQTYLRTPAANNQYTECCTNDQGEEHYNDQGQVKVHRTPATFVVSV